MMLREPIVDNELCKKYLAECERQRKAGMEPKTKVVLVMTMQRITHRGHTFLLELNPLRVRLYLRGVESWVEFVHGEDIEDRMRAYLDKYLDCWARYATSHSNN